MTDQLPVSHWPHGITYQIFVQSFYDSNGDGIGDLNGITEKLAYLSELGIEALWLMPLHPSPSYHKYDVTDYYDIHPEYGTLEDFKKLVSEAHKRGIKVIIDLVISHCSEQHPWFVDARSGPDSRYRDFFIWATEEKIEELGTATKEVAEDSDNIIQWNDVEGQEEKYFAYFWKGMPDFNFDNPELKSEIFKTGKYWLRETNIDGFRLDAAKHIFPDDRQEDNHAFWIEFRKEMEQVKPDVHLVGEVWDRAEIVAPYLVGLKSNFNFDLAEALIKAIKESDATGLIEEYLAVKRYYEQVTEDFIDATFLRNHDQNRVISLFEDHREKAKLAASLLLTLPGSPYLYYGEEIGMRGLKPDQYVREPFLWDHQSKGQTTWMNSQYNTNLKVDSLQTQQTSPHSIYQHYKALIKLRREDLAISKGTLIPLPVENVALCTYLREWQGNTRRVIHNLSDTAQPINEEGMVCFLTETARKQYKGTELPPFATLILKS